MDSNGFGVLNWLVLIVYLAAMLGVGIYFSKSSGKDTHAFFKAGGHIPGWAAGLSVYATTLSAITFMSIPERAFLTDWTYAASNITIIAIVPILLKFYIPFFRKLDVTTAYEYLEARFGVSLRLFGSIMFVLFHIGRIAIVIYLPTLAISSVSSLNPYLIAVCIGLLCIVYTYLGGMKGVIWSDVIQAIVLLGGALLIIFIGVYKIDGGWGTVLNDAVSNNKFVPNDSWKWSFHSATIPIIFLGSIFNNLHQYTASQDVVQRYTVTVDSKETKRTLWTNAFFAAITIPVFFGIGTILYSYYTNVEPLADTVNTSAIVPYFVLTNFPAGIAGLVIAAIFAASQSTISSSLNSISACIVVDIQKRFFPGLKEVFSVKLARWVVLVTGLFGLLASLYLIQTNQQETWDLFLAFVGLFGVPIAAIFALGIFTRRGNITGAWFGLIGSGLISYFLQQADWNAFFISLYAFISSLVLGYMFSLLFAKKTKDVTGLTVHSIK